MNGATDSIVLPSFIRRTLGLRARRRLAYDSAVRVRWGDSAYLLSHPDDVRHVLVDNPKNYSKTRQLTSARGRMRAGSGLLTASGEEHRRQRGLLQPLFHRRAIETFLGVMTARVERMLARWQEGLELDIAHEMADLTLSVMLGTLFGNEERDDEPRLIRAIDARRKHTDYVYHSRLPFREHLPVRIVRDYRRAIRCIDEIIAAEIALRRRDQRPRRDLLSMLMNASYADGSTMTDGQIRDEVLTLTSAGYETLGEALTWSWYLLALHADVQAKVFAEVDSKMSASVATADDIEGLEITDCVLRESMRLYPPTWIFERVASDEDHLPSGAVVRSGGKVYLCQYVMHRHPRTFPSPERFDPGRFQPRTQRPFRFAYFPFGDGPHTCIGENFAMLQGVCILASVSRRFRLELVAGQTIVPRAGVTLSPRHGIRVRARRR